MTTDIHNFNSFDDAMKFSREYAVGEDPDNPNYRVIQHEVWEGKWITALSPRKNIQYNKAGNMIMTKIEFDPGSNTVKVHQYDPITEDDPVYDTELNAMINDEIKKMDNRID